MARYKGAAYQQDTINELCQQAEVFLYGPGFTEYDPNDSLANIQSKAPFDIECIVVGHSWLPELVDEPPLLRNCDFRTAEVPLVAILNKEYNNLHNKLQYLTKNRFNLVFSHHHNSQTFGEAYGLNVVFWPFGFDDKKISNQITEKDIDLAFSGIIQNRTTGVDQTDSRLRVMNEMFYCVSDLPIRKRSNYSDLEIFWNAIPLTSKRYQHFVKYRTAKLLFPRYGYRYLEEVKYYELLARSKIVLNTLSPMELMGPRLFETMASGAVVLAEESSVYAQLFPKSCMVQFKSDLTDYLELIESLIADENLRKKLALEGKTFVSKGHKWSDRVSDMLHKINGLG